MKKFIIAVAVAILIATGLNAAPAQATTPDFYGPWSCQNYRDIATCVSLDWAKQADGSGVRLEGIQVATNQGCGSLESGGRYDPVRANAINENTGAMDYQYNFGVEPCNFYKDVSNAVGGAGSALIYVTLHARINLAHDKLVNWVIELGPNGGYTVRSKYVEDV